jgi:hypothetical protein
MTFLKIFENFNFFIIKSPDDVCMLLAWLVSSASPSGGNQVDGLPPASSKDQCETNIILKNSDVLVDKFEQSCRGDHAAAMQRPCSIHAAAMQLPCSCHAAAMQLPCSIHAASMQLPCSCHAASMQLPCSCHAAAMY